MYGARQPSWQYAKDSIDFSARLSYIFQSGVPKRDIAFYQKITTYPSILRNYDPTDLQEAGYTYEYLSPDNFDLPEAYVQNSVLAHERQAFKVLVVRANDSMTVTGVEKLAEYAHAGLPIVFIGGLPTYLLGTAPESENSISKILEPIKRLRNVHVVPYEGLAATLASIGINPLTKISANGTWFTYWRRDKTEGLDYVFVYNDVPWNSVLDRNITEGTIEFTSVGTPYLFDAWTGAQTPLLNYTRTAESTKVFFRLASRQSVIVAFADRPLKSVAQANPAKHVVSADRDVLSFRVSHGDIVALVGPGSLSLCATTSDGKTHSLKPLHASPLTLTDWTLTVESWGPSSNLSDATTTIKKNSTHRLTHLTSWQNIIGLQNVSGVGYYSTSFIWPPSSAPQHTSPSRGWFSWPWKTSHTRPSTTYQHDRMGAIIDFGPIVHTLRVRINGQTIPPLDLAWARADIAGYLRRGENVVEAIVTTTLHNVLRPIYSDLQTSAGPNPFGSGDAQDYGLLGEVKVIPYRATVLK